ncbi:hypothetical protein AC579_1190 [Pseudocercospora musae]|uniref:Uncharacterized protein n=1 Tax=Pseudocercospora musae TaxID=113226 RepID=A0A139I6J9_9PEZI|nr:hypothetical protein AC579_1190 [Pseudocercospora musae]
MSSPESNESQCIESCGQEWSPKIIARRAGKVRIMEYHKLVAFQLQVQEIGKDLKSIHILHGRACLWIRLTYLLRCSLLHSRRLLPGMTPLSLGAFPWHNPDFAFLWLIVSGAVNTIALTFLASWTLSVALHLAIVTKRARYPLRVSCRHVWQLKSNDPLLQRLAVQEPVLSAAICM